MPNSRNRTGAIPSIYELAVGQHLAGFPYLVVTALFGLATHFLVSVDIAKGHVLLRIASVLVANLVMVLMLAGAYLLNRSTGNRVSPRVFALFFLVAGAIRGAILEYLLLQNGLANLGGYAYRVFVGAFNFGVSAWCLAILGGLVAEFRRQSNILAAERVYLARLQGSVDTQISEGTEMEINAFREYLLTNLKVSETADANLVREHLRNRITDVIRPVVEQMLAKRTAVSVADQEPMEAKVKLGNVWRSLTVTDSLHPLIQGLFPVLATGATAFLAYPPVFAVLLIAMLAVVFTGLLWLAKLFIAARLDGLSLPLRVFSILAIFELAILPTALVALASPTLGHGGPAAPLAFFYAIFAGIGAGYWTTYTRELNRVYQRRNRYLELIHWKVAEVNSRRWHQQLHFARRVHGELQSKVAAMAIRLDQALAKGDVDEAEVARARVYVEGLVREVFEAPDKDTNLGEVLTEIAETWEGVCQITISLTDGDAQQILGDQIAVETALEVVREGISNAIRHGKAKYIEVSVSLISDDVIRVYVANDGQLVDSEGRREGMGSKYLQDCAISYSLTQTEHLIVLTADLPFRG